MTPRLSKHYDRKVELFNAQMVQLYHAILLDERDCSELLEVINEKFPGKLSNIAHHLRMALNLSIDVQRSEDALVMLKQMRERQASGQVTVIFHGGPCAGDIRAYPDDQGAKIILPCSNGSEIIYEKDESAFALRHFRETGQVVYQCTFNGAAK